MQFTTIALALSAAAAAVASPLEVRNEWGSCASECQYTCTTNGLLNVLTCVSALNGNTITIPISLGLRAREEYAAQEIEKRTGDPTCCTTNGLVNILTCVDLLNGNSISVPIDVVLGWL